MNKFTGHVWYSRTRADEELEKSNEELQKAKTNKLWNLAEDFAARNRYGVSVSYIMMWEYYRKFGISMIDELFNEKDMKKRDDIFEKYNNISNSKR